MQKIRILAIEDDPLHAESLRVLLEEKNYIVIDIVDDIDEFRRLVKATLPDLLLIDIGLGAAIDGVELAQEVTITHDVPFIFISAHQDNETVTRATEALPCAYITKPFSVASLQAAIELAINRYQQYTRTEKTKSPINCFLVKAQDRFEKVNKEEILYIEAQNKLCKLQLIEMEKLITAKITVIANQLPPDNFIQIHRSFVVNLEKITEIDSDYSFLKVGLHQIPIGRSYKDILMQTVLKIG